jgi:hypothetical protein
VRPQYYCRRTIWKEPSLAQTERMLIRQSIVEGETVLLAKCSVDSP